MDGMVLPLPALQPLYVAQLNSAHSRLMQQPAYLAPPDALEHWRREV